MTANALRRDDNWIQTHSGAAVWPTDFKPQDININDVAHALANQCRFAGHCLRFYSVAEHSCHIADAASTPNKMAALLHDGPEYILGDMAKPLKREMPDYNMVEGQVEYAFAKRFDLPFPLPAEVKDLDERIIVDERFQNMSQPVRPWLKDEVKRKPLGVRLQFWTPDKASFEFLARFYQLGGHYL